MSGDESQYFLATPAAPSLPNRIGSYLSFGPQRLCGEGDLLLGRQLILHNNLPRLRSFSLQNGEDRLADKKATGSDGIPANILKAWCSTASTTTLATLQLLGTWTHPPGQAGHYHRPLIQEQRRSERLQHLLRSIVRVTLARLQTFHLEPIQEHSMASEKPWTRSHYANCRRGAGRADATLHRIGGPNEGIRPGQPKCSQSLHQRLPFKIWAVQPLTHLQKKS